MDRHNELKNRTMHVDFIDDSIQSANPEVAKCQSATLDCTLEELAVLKVIMDNARATQKMIAEKTGQSERTVKRRTTSLQEKGIIQRVNGKRSGKW